MGVERPSGAHSVASWPSEGRGIRRTVPRFFGLRPRFLCASQPRKRARLAIPVGAIVRFRQMPEIINRPRSFRLTVANLSQL